MTLSMREIVWPCEPVLELRIGPAERSTSRFPSVLEFGAALEAALLTESRPMPLLVRWLRDRFLSFPRRIRIGLAVASILVVTVATFLALPPSEPALDGRPPCVHRRVAFERPAYTYFFGGRLASSG
jgi:hypothetical protein